MIGNVVIYEKKYIIISDIATDHVYAKRTDGSIMYSPFRLEDLEPVEITEKIKEKINLYPTMAYRYLHQVQNHRTLNEAPELDITPLFSIPLKQLTTFDGVDILDPNTPIWVCKENGLYGGEPDTPEEYKADEADQLDEGCIIFATKEVCQAYLNKINNLVCISEDGKNMYPDTICYTWSIKLLKPGFPESKPISQLGRHCYQDPSSGWKIFSTKAARDKFVENHLDTLKANICKTFNIEADSFKFI